MKARALLETAIYGRDLDRLERFYVDVFGLDVILRANDRLVALRCGNSALLLFDPTVTTQGGHIPPHGTSGGGHIAFVMEEDEREAWKQQLARHDVAIEREVEWPEGGISIYVRDPAGNSVELVPPRLWSGLGRAMLQSLDGP